MSQVYAQPCPSVGNGTPQVRSAIRVSASISDFIFRIGNPQEVSSVCGTLRPTQRDQINLAKLNLFPTPFAQVGLVRTTRPLLHDAKARGDGLRRHETDMTGA